MSNAFRAMEHSSRPRVIWGEDLFGGLFGHLLSLHKQKKLAECPIRISEQTWNDETKGAMFGFIEQLQTLSEVIRSRKEEKEKEEEERKKKKGKKKKKKSFELE